MDDGDELLLFPVGLCEGATLRRDDDSSDDDQQSMN
jgi:hypothetical protein